MFPSPRAGRDDNDAAGRGSRPWWTGTSPSGEKRDGPTAFLSRRTRDRRNSPMYPEAVAKPKEPQPQTRPVYHCTRCSATNTSKGGTCGAPQPGGGKCKGKFE